MRRVTANPLDNRVSTTPVLTLLPGGISAGTLLVAFTLMAVGFDHFWIAFPLGFGVVLPTAVGIRLYVHTTDRHADARTNTQTQTAHDEDTALETLKKRYARGDLSETEFEQRVERLLETESTGQRDDSITFNGG